MKVRILDESPDFMTIGSLTFGRPFRFANTSDNKIYFNIDPYAQDSSGNKCYYADLGEGDLKTCHADVKIIPVYGHFKETTKAEEIL